MKYSGYDLVLVFLFSVLKRHQSWLNKPFSEWKFWIFTQYHTTNTYAGQISSNRVYYKDNCCMWESAKISCYTNNMWTFLQKKLGKRRLNKIVIWWEVNIKLLFAYLHVFQGGCKNLKLSPFWVHNPNKSGMYWMLYLTDIRVIHGQVS